MSGPFDSFKKPGDASDSDQADKVQAVAEAILRDAQEKPRTKSYTELAQERRQEAQDKRTELYKTFIERYSDELNLLAEKHDIDFSTIDGILGKYRELYREELGKGISAYMLAVLKFYLKLCGYKFDPEFNGRAYVYDDDKLYVPQFSVL